MNNDVRLIDANKLTRWIEINKANINPLDYNTKATYAECITMVNAMETIDAEPVHPAVWRRKDKEQVLFGVEWECTNCHEAIALDGILTPIGNGFKFCPYCGAKMKGVEQDAVD